MSTEGIEKKRVLKVYVKMHDGTRLLGMFYLGKSERLQDVMNDDRIFLPLHAYDDKGHKQRTLMLAKRYIEQVEEFDGKENQPSAAYEPPLAHANPAWSKPSLQPIVELSLDDVHFGKPTGDV